MKLSTFLIIFLVIGAVFFVFVTMTDEVKEYYPNPNQNTSEWAGKYDFSTNISKDINKTIEPLSKLGDENKGWVLRVVSGIAAIPTALIAFISIIINSFVFGSLVTTGMFSSLGIPAYLTGIAIIMILVWGVTKLIEIVQRWQI